MTNLYELYQSYKDRDIDDEFIIKAFDYMMINEQDLWPYIHDFGICEKQTDFFGTYSNDNKSIVINKKAINENTLLSKNVLGINAIKHEIEHAKNLKKLEEGKNDIESKVLFYALRSYAIASGLEPKKISEMDLLILTLATKNNPSINPGERLAYINSWKYVVNLLKNQNKTKDLLDVRTMLYCSYIRGYHDNGYYLDCPTFRFLLETNQLLDLKLLKKRIAEEGYSFDTRLLYGLPLTYDEYNQDTLEKARLKKIRKKN